MKVITDKNFDRINCIKYAFFTKLGGFSEGEFCSLNFNSKAESGEPKENILKNFDVVKNFFGTQNAFKMKQIHSNKAFVLDDLKWLSDIDIVEADAVITKLQNVAIGITTADCAPIFLVDDINQVIAAIHAGWRSAIGGIIKNSIFEMRKLGADVNNIKALVGPHLRVRDFEVREDFIDILVKNNINYFNFIVCEDNDKMFFDISKFIEFELRNNGVVEVNDVGIDTYSNQDLFFSYRRSKHDNKEKFGCQFSGIMLK